MEYREREQRIRQYFQAWLDQDSSLLDGLFDPNVTYSESWGPEYQGFSQVLHWFTEWNTRARVLQWEIKLFLHQGNLTAVEWRFRNRHADGAEEHFDGVSLVEFTPQGTIISVKEFGSKLPHFNPYDEDGTPEVSGIWKAE